MFDRTSGKPVEGPSEGVPAEIQMPNLATAANCAGAFDRIVEALWSGTVDREIARLPR